MHVQLITILDHKLEEAIVKFSSLPFQAPVFNFNRYDQILQDCGLLIKTHLDFFMAVKLLPHSYQYYKRSIQLTGNNVETYSKVESVNDNSTLLAVNQAIAARHGKLSEKEQSAVVPIYQHFNGTNELMIFAGVGIMEEKTAESVSLLHQLSIPITSMEFTTYRPVYLMELLKDYQKDTSKSVQRLAAQFGKSYRQVQNDSKIYFGTTLYSFVLKLRMLHTLHDIMFTDLTLKEIAYKNNFLDYGSMHRIFSKQYQFPFKRIPRFLELSSTGIIWCIVASFCDI